jgi:hypothetical protein
MHLVAAGRYALLVLALMVVGALLLNWMAVGALVVDDEPPAPPAATPPAGWREFTPPGEKYRIWLPESWELHTPASPGWEGLVAEAASPVPSRFATAEPRRAVDRVSLVAESPAAGTARPFMVSVDHHPNLADTGMSVLQAEGWSAGAVPIHGAVSVYVRRQAWGQRVLVAELAYPANGTDLILHALTYVVKTDWGLYAISASAEETSFWHSDETLWQILDSFAPLRASGVASAGA